MLIGLDLDNTIIDYDRAFVRAGRMMRLLPEHFDGTKRDVRGHLRAEPDGDVLWQRLQAHVYGPVIGEAVPSPGIKDFIALCHANGFGVAIISHKTQFASADPAGTDLRLSAIEWLRQNGLSDYEGAPLPIYFADTRGEKLARIADLGCRYFVDDLEEVLLDADFPRATTGILFAPVHERGKHDLPVCRTWDEVAAYILYDIQKDRS